MPGALLTDLYQLTMAHAYFEQGMHDTAVFELYVRRLPPQRRFLVAAGLEQALDYVRNLHFTAPELDFLGRDGAFPPRFLDFLGTVRFTGTVHAMPEGTPFFANEPIVRVTAPIIEAQLLESRLLNIIHFQTLIASKAVRCVIAARGRGLADYGMRRSHEGDAALFAARAAYLAGFDATATVEAGRRFGIPIVGTMAHSFVEAHDDEEQAFRHFTCSRPGRTTLLIDTYDTRGGAARAARLNRALSALGSAHGVGSVRIDSGDLAAEALAVRRILDEHECRDIKIVLSGGLDEQRIDELVSAGVPVDSFGVGTSLAVSADAPALDMAYKLQMYAGHPRRKRSPGKATWPGAKQVFRESGADGHMLRDRITLDGERSAGTPLLEAVIREGKAIAAQRSLATIREECPAQIRALPPAVLSLNGASGNEPPPYPVVLSPTVEAVAASADSAIR